MKKNIIKIKDDYINQLQYITENTQETSRIGVDTIKQRDEEIKKMKPNVPQTQNKNLLNMISLMKTNEPNHYDYYVMRFQRRNVNRQRKNIEEKFINMVLL